MFLANYGTDSQLFHASQHLSSNIRTTGPITKIFRKALLMAIRSRKTCFDRYLGHALPLLYMCCLIFTDRLALRK
jgi:hypothetical protein